jgi:hypothetical protein
MIVWIGHAHHRWRPRQQLPLVDVQRAAIHRRGQAVLVERRLLH